MHHKRHSPVCKHEIVDINPCTLTCDGAVGVCNERDEMSLIERVECTLKQQLLVHRVLRKRCSRIYIVIELHLKGALQTLMTEK